MEEDGALVAGRVHIGTVMNREFDKLVDAIGFADVLYAYVQGCFAVDVAASVYVSTLGQ